MFSAFQPPSNNKSTLYQIGIQDNGDAAFQRAATKLKMPVVLIETPSTIQKLKSSGREHEFHKMVAVEKLENAKEVDEALHREGCTPNSQDVFISDGHDRCVPTMYALSEQYDAAPARIAQGFRPMGKIVQRRKLDEVGIPQPPWKEFNINNPSEVQSAFQHVGSQGVVKADDGCFGLGTRITMNQQEYDDTIQEFSKLSNFGGAEFSGFLYEGLVPHKKSVGIEHMVNGVADGDDVHVFSTTDKINSIKGGNVTRVAQIVYPPNWPGREHLNKNAKEYVNAQGYKLGAFHLDLMDQAENPDKPLFLEKGPRPSGSYQVHDLVSPYPPIAEQALRLFRGMPLLPPDHTKPQIVAGDLTSLDQAEADRLLKLQESPPPGVELHFIKNTLPNQAAVGRMVVTANDPQKVFDVIGKVADLDRRFEGSTVASPWEAKDASLHTSVDLSSSVVESRPGLSAEMSGEVDENTPLIQNQQQHLTRGQLARKYAENGYKTVKSTLRSTIGCCLPGGR